MASDVSGGSDWEGLKAGASMLFSAFGSRSKKQQQKGRARFGAEPPVEDDGDGRDFSATDDFYSPATKDRRRDGQRDDREDLRLDQISELVLPDIDGDDAEPIDPWDAKDAQAHRKKMAVFSLSKRRTAERSAAVQEERTLAHVKPESAFTRDVTVPNGVWTLGDGSLGQLGHTAAEQQEEPRPAPLDSQILRGGVRSIHAGRHCTVVVNQSGEAIGFGSGPFRSAAAPSAGAPASALEYAGAPPYCVEAFTGVGDEEEEGEEEAGVGSLYYSTEQMVAARIHRRAVDLSAPTVLSGLLMPVETLSCGEDFCVALMQNGLVFSWGDGEEGKLGLGRPESHERPTMVDFLLPTAYAEVAKRSANKDDLLKAGSRLIRSRGRSFQITSLSCGTRHAMALASTSELFTWGSGCSGQLGHGTKHDEVLPRPVDAFKSRRFHVRVIAAGGYHSAAIVDLTRTSASRLFTWGEGESGRLGLGDERSRMLPNQASFHRTSPLSRLRPGADDRGGGGVFSFRRGDWLSEDGGHAHEWAELACGTKHAAALTRSGQVYTWGSDEAGQLGHGGRVNQRIPCLLSTLIRPTGLRRPKMAAVSDARALGCGRRFTALLTWSGEVFVWGRLGAQRFPRPAMVERLRGAAVVSIACGEDHVVMLTGDVAELRAQVSGGATDARREAAILHEARTREAQVAKAAATAAEAAAEKKKQKAEAKAEKRRVKVLGRLAKQRMRLAGIRKTKKQSKEDEQKEAQAKMEREEDEKGGGKKGFSALKKK